MRGKGRLKPKSKVSDDLCIDGSLYLTIRFSFTTPQSIRHEVDPDVSRILQSLSQNA
jgi:hypothetical protein